MLPWARVGDTRGRGFKQWRKEGSPLGRRPFLSLGSWELCSSFTAGRIFRVYVSTSKRHVFVCTDWAKNESKYYHIK